MGTKKQHDPDFGSLEGLAEVIKKARAGNASVAIILLDCDPVGAKDVYWAGKIHVRDKANPKKHNLRDYDLPDSKAFDITTRIEKVNVTVTVAVTDNKMRAAL